MEAPVNNKSLIAFLCNQMKKLDNKEITVQEAQAQCNIVNSICKVLNYEISRVNTEMKIREFNLTRGSNVALRQLEQKGFDDTTSQR